MFFKSTYNLKLRAAIIAGIFFAHSAYSSDSLPNTNEKLAKPVKKPVIALVLSGGAANGIAEIPLLEAIEEEGIPVDMVLGVSMGSIIGSFYASGYSPKEIREVFTTLDIPGFLNQKSSTAKILAPVSGKPYSSNFFSLDFSRDGIGSQTGILGDQKITNIIASCIVKTSYIEDFDKLPKIFRAVSTDVFTGDRIISSNDSILSAVRGSMAIPIIFPPFPTGTGSLAFDGGLADNLPIQLARDMGADIVIAIDVVSKIGVSQEDFSSINSSIVQSINLIISHNAKRQYNQADILLTPDLSGLTALRFGHPKEILEIGQKEVDAHRQEIHELALKLQEAGVVLDKKPYDYESEYSKMPFPIVGSISIKDISMEKGRVLPNEDAFKSFLGKELNDEEMLHLTSLLEQLRYEYNLSTLTFQMRKMHGHHKENEYELQILANHHPQANNRLYAGGRPIFESTFGSGEKCAFKVFPFFSFGVKLSDVIPFTFNASTDEFFNADLSFNPLIYQSELYKIRAVVSGGAKYGTLHPENVITYSTLFADDDFGFDGSASVNIQRKDTMTADAGLIYDFNYLHNSKQFFNDLSLFVDFAADTLKNDVTSLKDYKIDTQLLAGVDFSKGFVYAGRFSLKKNYELTQNLNSIGLEAGGFWNRYQPELLKGWYDAGTFDGMCGHGYGTFSQNFIFAGVSYRHVLFTIADMPFLFIAQAKLGFSDTFDAGTGTYLALSTPVGTILLGGSWSFVKNNWCLELSFR